MLTPAPKNAHHGIVVIVVVRTYASFFIAAAIINAAFMTIHVNTRS